jgi:hypothetical protein
LELTRRDATWKQFPSKSSIHLHCAAKSNLCPVHSKIAGVSLHSYRYAWAERALKCGFPERFAQQALGYNSKAMHQHSQENIEFRLRQRKQLALFHAAPAHFLNGDAIMPGQRAAQPECSEVFQCLRADGTPGGSPGAMIRARAVAPPATPPAI